MIKNILLLCGGGSSEHEISLLSANFVEQQLNLIQNVKVTRVEIKMKVGLQIKANWFTLI